MHKNIYRISLIFLFLLQSFFIFYRLTYPDSTTDGSIYSKRAVGYVDYVLPKNQTAPLQWFGYMPWWSKLSFHDAPPLVFIIQHIFFRIFGENIFAMRLPFALAGLGTWFLVYIIGKKFFSEVAGLFSVMILTASTYFTWISRTAFLEGIEVFFVTLAIYAFLQFLQNPKKYIFLGISLGFSILTKYTSFFLFLFILSYLYIYQRKYFLKKELYYAFIIAFGLFSPVIFYNIMLFSTRGHFDVQFSQLFSGQVFESARRDWPVLFYPESGKHYFLANFSSIFGILSQAMSPSAFIVFLGAILYSFYRALVSLQKVYGFFILAFASLVVMFTVLSPALRLTPLFLPVLALLFGLSLKGILDSPLLKNFKAVIMIAGISAVFFEGLYNFRTNIAVSPSGVSRRWSSDFSEKSLGFQELEKYLLNYWKNDRTYTETPRKITTIDDFTLDWRNLKDNNVYLYDTDLNWFARLWHLNRYYTYHGIPIFTDAELMKILGPKNNVFDALKYLGVKNVFYIKGLQDNVYSGGYKNNTKMREGSEILEKKFREYISASSESNIQDIENKLGEPAFRVFQLKL